ncbi:1-deoxyxylulose-5-phosphate synthase YajO-like isoform X1 [Babylonia areolata]|uniref:1-deoxyxylulose-5-phosphate synthase YajO-like isoform X1 n=1 Tax=Babylonia areolata TaxID=304850 RepID=UPI003FD0270A
MANIADDRKCLYTFLGKSGLRVSNMCLGGMTFGASPVHLPGQLDESQSHRIINRFVEWGGNFIDTANVYGYGNSEKIIGSWLAGQERDRFVIATKARLPMDMSNPNCMGLSRRHLIHSVEKSLERLQTHYIDLLQSHVWDDAVPLEETLRTMNDLVRCGKVRYLGTSNVTGWQLQKIVDLSAHMGLDQFVSLQQQYNLLCRTSELESFQVCKLNGIGVLPWGPLRGGFLTDKVKQDHLPEEGRLAKSIRDEQFGKKMYFSWSHLNQDSSWAIHQAAEKVAKARGKSVAQVSLRWLLQKSVVSSVIIGATKMHQLDDNMAAATGWQLTPEEMKELDEVSTPGDFYPYDFIPWLNGNRDNPWNPRGYV